MAEDAETVRVEVLADADAHGDGDGDALEPFAVAGAAGRYVTGAVLGAGGMGEVRSHVDRATGRSVAMKTMHAPGDALALRRFAREARIQSQLEHPSIIPVYDIGVADGAPYITMKHVRGESLAHVLTRLRSGDDDAEARFTPRRLLAILSTVALTVEYAHQRGVIHRDLKPENIMLGPFGEVYVLDWGLAAIVEEHEPVSAASSRTTIPPASAPVVDTPGSVQTAAGAILGTPGYIAPELLEPAAEATPRSDTYALGAILFEVLAGERMHRGDSIGQILGSTMDLDGASPRDRAIARDIAPELDAICVAATRRDPARRTPSAGAFARAIEHYLDGDRDLAVRRELASRAVDRASATPPGGATAETHRAALRDVTIALGLVPDDPRARALLVQLLTRPPAGAERLADELARDETLAAFRLAARTHLFVLSTYVLYIPLMLWMGIRAWWMVGAVAGATAVLFGLTLRYYLRPPRDLDVPIAHVVLSFIAIASGSFLVGPLILVPSIVVATGVVYLASFERRVRWIAAGSFAAVFAPLALQLAGLLPPSYEFADGEIHVVPAMTELPPVPTLALLIVTHSIVIGCALYFTWRLRRAYVGAARALRLQAWQLAQLTRSEADTPPPVS